MKMTQEEMEKIIKEQQEANRNGNFDIDEFDYQQEVDLNREQ